MQTDELAPWIAGSHLEEAAVREHRAAFEADPARLVMLEGFLRSDVAERLAEFFAEGAEYSREYGLYSAEGGVDAEAWERAPDDDRFFRYDKLTGIKPEAALSDGALTYMRFRSFVTEPAFRGYFEELTGLPLGPSDDFGGHAFEVGDFLRDHDDANKDRRLAIVLYLTPGWQPDFGGALVMGDRTGAVRRFDASFDTLAVFDTIAGTTHRVEPVLEAAAGSARRTFGGWFPNPPA
jgi:2OG-Fe(II) oxygenase superfamily